MKSFILACVATVAIAVIANLILTNGGFSAANATTVGEHVRLGDATDAGTDDRGRPNSRIKPHWPRIVCLAGLDSFSLAGAFTAPTIGDPSALACNLVMPSV